MKSKEMIKERGRLEREVMKSDELLCTAIEENTRLHMALEKQNRLIEAYATLLIYGEF